MLKRGRTQLTTIAILAVIALIIAFVGVRFVSDEETSASPNATTQTPMTTNTNANENGDPLQSPNPAGEIVLGAADAPITIIEYSSLTCGHCAAFHSYTLPQLKEKYVDTGLVQFKFRPFPFDPYAMAGAMLVYCVAPPRRVALLDVLFLRQSSWAATTDPMTNLQKLVQQAGLSEADFVVCLKDETLLTAIRDVQRTAAQQLGVRSTPTFFINGRKLEGNHPLSEFEKYIAPLLPTSEG